jgi:hypothetical protein
MPLKMYFLLKSLYFSALRHLFASLLMPKGIRSISCGSYPEPECVEAFLLVKAAPTK